MSRWNDDAEKYGTYAERRSDNERCMRCDGVVTGLYPHYCPPQYDHYPGLADDLLPIETKDGLRCPHCDALLQGDPHGTADPKCGCGYIAHGYGNDGVPGLYGAR